MKNSLLMAAIQRKKKKKAIDWDDPSVQQDGLSPGDISDVNADADADKTGQMADAKQIVIQDQDPDLAEKQAKEILGREPMSTVKKKKKKKDDDLEEGLEFDEASLAEMRDPGLIESLKEGRRKPKNLWDKVQLNIAKNTK